MRKHLIKWTSIALFFIFSTTGVQAADKIKIGVSMPAATHGWTAGLAYHAKKAKKTLEKAYPNIEFQIATASSSTEQANDLEDLVTVHKIKGLVILPFESEPLTEPVRNVKKSGAYVTVVDRGLSDPSIQDVYVAGDNPGLGRVSAEYMIKKLGGKGSIVVLRGIPTVIDTERFNAFMKKVKGTNIKVLDHKFANWNRDDGFKVMQDFLSRFPKIDAVWAQDDDIALGVIEAVKQAKREKELFIVGGAGMHQVIKMVMDGSELVPVDVLYPPAMIATAMHVTAMKFTSSVPVDGKYIIGSPLITKENAKSYYFPDSPF